MTRNRWEYKILDAGWVQSILAARQLIEAGGEGYVSDDEATRMFDGILADGYRWIRTDGDQAVFEREAPPIKASKPQALPGFSDRVIKAPFITFSGMGHFPLHGLHRFGCECPQSGWVLRCNDHAYRLSWDCNIDPDKHNQILHGEWNDGSVLGDVVDIISRWKTEKRWGYQE